MNDTFDKEKNAIQIVDLNPNDQRMITQTATLLLIGFTHSWPDMDSALAELDDCLRPDKINRIAVEENGLVIGWIGGHSMYDGNVWELHPLVVHPDYRGQNIGRMLVHDFEKAVKAHGGITIYLGADDEESQTSLANVDVYPNVLESLAQIKNLNRHPYEFYQKVGYAIAGMIPDANGIGKPDIIMAKRVSD